MNATRLIISLVLSAFLVGSCKKSKHQNVADNPVPYVPVSITLYPNDPLNLPVQGIGGWMYINGGINGIVLYRKSEQEFIAIERTSSQLPDDPKARVVVLKDNFTLADTVSNSHWRLIDGTVVQGPAEWSLRLYGTTYDGNALRIRN
jgi:hypothetical protein